MVAAAHVWLYIVLCSFFFFSDLPFQLCNCCVAIAMDSIAPTSHIRITNIHEVINKYAVLSNSSETHAIRKQIKRDRPLFFSLHHHHHHSSLSTATNTIYICCCYELYCLRYLKILNKKEMIFYSLVENTQKSIASVVGNIEWIA